MSYGVNYAPGYEQWALRLDCELEGCEQKLGYKHADDGRVSLIHRGELTVMKRHRKINGHACRLVRRVLPDWEVVR